MRTRSVSFARSAAFLAAIFVAPAAVPQAAASSSPVYNVELIVFRANTAYGGAENWSGQSGARGAASGGDAATGRTDVGRFVSALPSSKLQLGELAAKLRTNGNYEPVAHVAWSQTASAWGTRAGFPVQRLGINAEGLSGTVYLERGQYLHLGLALSYAMPNPPGGLGAGSGTTFTLNESRRVRLYERNYYDHPAFGVIALVTPAQGARPVGR